MPEKTISPRSRTPTSNHPLVPVISGWPEERNILR